MPLFDAPWLAAVLNLLVLCLALGITLSLGRSAKIELFAATVTLSVILFPMALEYHYTLLLIPLAVMSARVFAAISPGCRMALDCGDFVVHSFYLESCAVE